MCVKLFAWETELFCSQRTQGALAENSACVCHGHDKSTIPIWLSCPHKLHVRSKKLLHNQQLTVMTSLSKLPTPFPLAFDLILW
jgi:hypothetical protein